MVAITIAVLANASFVTKKPAACGAQKPMLALVLAQNLEPARLGATTLLLLQAAPKFMIADGTITHALHINAAFHAT